MLYIVVDVLKELEAAGLYTVLVSPTLSGAASKQMEG